MFKKVIFGTEMKTEDGVVLGKKVGGGNGYILIENDSGEQTTAFFGVVDKEGKFWVKCVEGNNGNQLCVNAIAPSCGGCCELCSTAGYYTEVM